MMQKIPEIKIERTWAMPNKWAFTVKPIRDIVIVDVRFMPQRRYRGIMSWQEIKKQRGLQWRDIEQ